MCRYEVGKKKGEYDEETLKREQAKNALERYMHYYQRYNALSYYIGTQSRPFQQAAIVEAVWGAPLSVYL